MNEWIPFGMYLFRVSMGDRGFASILANKHLVYDLHHKYYLYMGWDGYYEIRYTLKPLISVALITDEDIAKRSRIKIVTTNRPLRIILDQQIHGLLNSYHSIYGRRCIVKFE